MFVTVTGALEYFDDHGAVISRTTTSSATRSYQAFLAAHRPG